MSLRRSAIIIFILWQVLFFFCSKKEEVEIITLDPKLKLTEFETNAIKYDRALQKNGAILLDKKISGLISSQDADAFIWQKENILVYYNVAENLKKDLEYSPNLVKYALSPQGTSVLFYYKDAEAKGRCQLLIESIKSGKKSKKITMPKCKIEGTIIDSSYDYDSLVSIHSKKTIDKIEDQDKAEQKNLQSSSVAIVLTFKNGINIFNPFVSDWKKSIINILPYAKIPSFHSLVPSSNSIIQIPGKEELLIVRGNAGAYKLYRYNILKNKLYKYNFRMKLPYLKLSSNLNTALLIKGGAGSERIYRVNLYNKKQKRFKVARRENPFDDSFGNIYYYLNNELVMIPVIGQSRKLPLFVHAFFPLANGMYLVETYAGNIMLLPLRFNTAIYKLYLALKKTSPKTVE